MPLNPDDLAALDRVAREIRPGRRVLFITGAGLSADSGLPTYRGVGGLYAVDEKTPFGCTIEEGLSGPMFAARPEVTWSLLVDVIRHARAARHNAGHAAIAAIEGRIGDVWTLTQNVDGFHRDAGSKNLIEIHGCLRTVACTGRRCLKTGMLLTDATLAAIPPRCDACGSVVRPEVVLFGETLAESTVDALVGQLALGFDVVLSVGTSSLFPYISAPVHRARIDGGLTVEINPADTDLSDDVDVKIRARAAEALTALAERIA